MSVQAISKYLNEKLLSQLIGYGASTQYSEYICQVVEAQMMSVLLHWQDVAFRKALLLIASEEGSFYEPAGKNDVKCFVVLTLRNSPFESLQSKNYEKCNLSEVITDDQIKATTSSAIRYFNKLDFNCLSREAQNKQDYSDIYGDLSKRCPVSWKALINLASSSAKCVTFKKAEIKEPFHLEGVDNNAPERSKQIEAIVDGYSKEIDSILSQQLSYVTSGQGPMVVDCFKMLSRNIEKLLSVMEFLLTRNCAFVTSNYYIENGYTERRTEIVRAASCKHSMKEMEKHFSMINGLGPKHTYALKAVLSQLNE